MTRDDIVRLARKADPGFETDTFHAESLVGMGAIERFAALVAAAEREACARVCEDDKTQAMEWMGASRPGGYFAAAIRSRA